MATTTERVLSSTDAGLQTEIKEIVRRSEVARDEIAKLSAEIDKSGDDPREAMKLVWETGIFQLSLSREYGGLSDGTIHFAFEPLIEAYTNITAGEGSCGMMTGASTICLRMIFGRDSGFSAEALEEIAQRVRTSETRFVNCNSEAGSPRPVTIRSVEGGAILDGVKTFATGSGSDNGYLLVGCLREADRTFVQSVVPLDHPRITKNDDWDNMGMRATCSGSVDFNEVFVPDGWFREVQMARFAGYLSPAFTLFSPILLGIGEGAFAAMTKYVRELNRASMAPFESASDDLMILRRIGEHKALLSAARALLLQTARKVEALEESDLTDIEAPKMKGLLSDAAACKAFTINAVLKVCNEMHELCGARATSNKYRFDQYWRNARAIASHDALDSKHAFVGSVELTGKMIPMFAGHGAFG